MCDLGKNLQSQITREHTSKWSTMASISSSQNGGLASNDPLSGVKERRDLYNERNN